MTENTAPLTTAADLRAAIGKPGTYEVALTVDEVVEGRRGEPIRVYMLTADGLTVAARMPATLYRRPRRGAVVTFGASSITSRVGTSTGRDMFDLGRARGWSW